MLENNGHRGITQVASWLDQTESRDRFKGRVYGPILCEVTVDNALNAQYLEQDCPSECPYLPCLLCQSACSANCVFSWSQLLSDVPPSLRCSLDMYMSSSEPPNHQSRPRF